MQMALLPNTIFPPPITTFHSPLPPSSDPRDARATFSRKREKDSTAALYCQVGDGQRSLLVAEAAGQTTVNLPS